MKRIIGCIFLVLTLESCAVLGGKDRYVYYFSPAHYKTDGIRGYVQVPTVKIFPYTHVHNTTEDDRWYSRAFRDAFCVGYGTRLSSRIIPVDVVWPVPQKLNKINQ